MEDHDIDPSPMDEMYSWNESTNILSTVGKNKRKYNEDSGCFTATPCSSSQSLSTNSWALGTSDEGFCESPRGKSSSWDTCGSSHDWDDWEKNPPFLPITPEIPISLPATSPVQPKLVKCRDRDIPNIVSSFETNDFIHRRPTNICHSRTDFIHRFAVLSNHHPILSRIFSYLSDDDITMMTMVSKTWYNVLTTNNATKERWKKHVIIRKLSKENLNAISSSTLLRSPLKAIINHSTPLHNTPSSPSPPCSPSKFNLFVKEAKKLKDGEWLMHCPSCDLPCKCTPIAKLAKCVRVGCSLEFCTDCRNSYHHGSPCVLLSPPGSKTPPKRLTKKQSRRNLRRLLS